MIDFNQEGLGTPLVIPSEHGSLHGSLVLQPNSPGLIVLAHAALALDGRDAVLAGFLRHAGLSTLSVDLLARDEERFPDAHNNVPVLAKRLLVFLDQIRHRMLMGEIATQPVGLCAANTTSAVVVRIASQRDHDIAAIVCRGGLIDLAGILYLRSLASPLLLLHEQSDVQHIASNRRALQEVRCPCELRIIADIGFDFAVSPGFDAAARNTLQWFLAKLNNTSSAQP